MNTYESVITNENPLKDQVDAKVVKKHYFRTNNDSVLEVVMEKDPNLYLVKNDLAIHCKIEVDDGYLVDNGFVSKLFAMLTVEVDSQVVSSNKTR